MFSSSTTSRHLLLILSPAPLLVNLIKGLKTTHSANYYYFFWGSKGWDKLRGAQQQEGKHMGEGRCFAALRSGYSTNHEGKADVGFSL